MFVGGFARPFPLSSYHSQSRSPLGAERSEIDGLVKAGKLIADTRTDLTRAGIGVEVRKGAPKPDISTVEAFKRAMLDAKSIGYLKIGVSGQMVAAMLERVGLTEAIKSKVTLPETDIVSEMVAEGKIDIGMVNIAQILTTPRGRPRRPAAARAAVLYRVLRRRERKLQGAGRWRGDSLEFLRARPPWR